MAGNHTGMTSSSHSRVLDLLFSDKARDRLKLEHIGVTDLRNYFRRPAGFFQRHLNDTQKP